MTTRPFCGTPEPQFVCGGPGNWYVRCLACGAASDDAMRDRALRLWNTRATPQQSRDGAEGTGQRCVHNVPITHACQHCGHGRVYTLEEIEAERAARRSAPPQPAPDALRICDGDDFLTQARKTIGHLSHAIDTLSAAPDAMRDAVEVFISTLRDNGLIVSRAAFDAVEKVRAALSPAPVPPADGVMRTALEWYADGINCRRGVFGRLARNGNRNQWEPDNGDTARAALASLPAVAGEAVAWAVLDNIDCVTRSKELAGLWQSAGLQVTRFYAFPSTMPATPTEKMVLAGGDVLLSACSSEKGNLRPWKPFDVAQVAINVWRAMIEAADPSAILSLRLHGRKALPTFRQTRGPDCFSYWRS